jgi:hypothetical protein
VQASVRLPGDLVKPVTHTFGGQGFSLVVAGFEGAAGQGCNQFALSAVQIYVPGQTGLNTGLRTGENLSGNLS